MKQFLFLLGIIGLCLLPVLFEKNAPIAVGIEVHTSLDENRTLEPAMNDALDDVLTFYARSHDIAFNGPLHIIFSQDTQYVTDTYYDLSRPHVSKKDARHFARSHCDADQTISGVITLKVMLLCISPVEDVNNRWIASHRDQIGATLAHEIMHAIQHKFSDESVTGLSARRASGPVWMVEGAANYISRDFQGALTYKDREFERVFYRAQDTTKSIDELSYAPPFERFKHYAISHLAIYLLAERFGAPALFDFWRNLGAGHNWENSFARAFGMQMSDFIEKFETLRRDPKAAKDWILADK